MPHSVASSGVELGRLWSLGSFAVRIPSECLSPMCKKRGSDLEPGFLKLWIHRSVPVLFAL